MAIIIGKNVEIDETVKFMECNGDVIIHDNVVIEPYTVIYGNVEIGANTLIGPACILGAPTASYKNDRKNHEFGKLLIGENSWIRSNTVIYEDNIIGNNFQTGHNVTIREKCKIGNNCSVGTLGDIQGKANIGNFVRLHSNVHIGQLTTIKDYVWMFPYSITTNDMYPPMDKLEGVTIDEFALITTGVILLPGVHVGKNALVAAGATVTKDVSEEAVVRGVPAKVTGSVRDIKDENGVPIYPWKDTLKEFRGYPWQINENGEPICPSDIIKIVSNGSDEAKKLVLDRRCN